MIRSCLTSENRLVINGKKYEIDDVVGQGSNCVVYNAHVVDSNRKVRIKECYPLSTSISRVDGTLIWENERRKRQAFQAFNRTYEKHLQIQNNPKLGNSFAHLVDEIGESNGTQYMVIDVDWGVTFDQEKKLSLQDIISTILALARVIALYHSQGYLYLDIKPENFLVHSESRENLVLIDADSIVKKDDILQGKVSQISFSKGWAAPEQLQGRLSKISERTDIYAIGAVLFEIVMGRCPENDDMGIGADWFFKEKVVKDYDPKIKQLLKQIFLHTLSANVNRRYKNVGELIADLEQALRLCSDHRFVLSHESINDIYFVGREKELENLHDLLQGEVKAVFLHGFGGIGKTELVKQYAKIHKGEYDATVFDRYSESRDKGLKQYIRDINIHGDDDKKKNVKEQIDVLRDIVTPKTLFIIDNFDVIDDEDLEDFLSLDAKFLFTTRYDHEDLASCEIQQMEVGVLDTDSLVELFVHEYERGLSKVERIIVEEIIEKFDNYTMIVTLIARLLRESEIPIEEFWKEIEEDGLFAYSEGTDEVSHRKDGRTTQKTLAGHIKKVFDMSGMTDAHKRALANVLDLCDLNDFTKQNYRKYTQAKNITALNDLINRGWVQKEIRRGYIANKDTVFLSFHPVIKELVENMLHDLKYHEDIINYVNHRFSLLKNRPENLDVRAGLGNTMSLYTKVIDLDTGQTEKYSILCGLIKQLFIEGSLDISKVIFVTADFKIPANKDYFFPKLLNQMILLMVESSNLSVCDRFLYKVIYVSLEFFESYNSDSRSKVMEIWTTALLETCCTLIDGLKLADLDSIIISAMVLNTFGNYFWTGILYEGKWILNEQSKKRFEFNGNNAATFAELYFKLAELSYYLGEYFASVEDIRTKKYKELYNDMIMVLFYYHGEYQNPFSFKADQPKKYEQLWEEVFKDEIFSPDGKSIKIENRQIILPIVTDKKNWKEKLGQSIWKNVILKTAHTYELYKVILDVNFLLEQPQSVQKSLLKYDLAKKIAEDVQLTESQKNEILITGIFEALNEIQRIETRREKKKRNSDSLRQRYSIIFNIYLNCLYKREAYIQKNVGKTFSQLKYQYYYSLFKLNSYKHIKDKVLVLCLAKEITEENICTFQDEIEMLIRLVYSNGFHVFANKMKDLSKKYSNE